MGFRYEGLLPTWFDNRRKGSVDEPGKNQVVTWSDLTFHNLGKIAMPPGVFSRCNSKTSSP